MLRHKVMLNSVFQHRLDTNAVSSVHMLKQRYMHLLSVLSVLSISFILAWISKGVGRERLGQTPGERKLGMTAKPAGPLYMCFFYVISVVIESLPMDVLHSHSIYLSLLTLSVPVPSTQNFSLAAAFISLFFCLSKRCLFYPASHRYSAKWLGCSHRIKVSFNILRMQTLHLFLRVLCARVLVLIPSPFVPPTLVLLFFFSKTFLWFTHMSSCVRRATGCLNRKQQIQVCVCVTTSRLAYAHAYACEKENTHEDQRLILSVTVCACSGRRLQCLSRTWGFFSWITKEEQPIEGGPAAFSLRRINPAYSQTHSQNAVIFIADLNSRKNLPSSRWFSFFLLFFCFFHRDL